MASCLSLPAKQWMRLATAAFALALVASPATAEELAPVSITPARHEQVTVTAPHGKAVQELAPVFITPARHEQVTVTAPRGTVFHRHVIGYTPRGWELQKESLSRAVHLNGLNLRTARGARVLRHRIRSTARVLCKTLEVPDQLAAPNSPPCYRTAVRDATTEANRAIRSARHNG